MGQAISGIGGGIIQGIGAKAEAESAREAAIFNARLTIQQRDEELEFLDKRQRQKRGENRTRVAKSGVRLEGSPLEVLANNAAETERQKMNVIRRRAVEFDKFIIQSQNAKFAEKMAVAGSVVQVAGSVVSAITSFGLLGGGGGGGSGLETFGKPNGGRNASS